MILYTWPEFFENEHVFLNQILEMGLKWLHIYKKNSTENEVENLLKKIDSKFYSNIVIHHYFNLALKYQAAGIHHTRNTIYFLNNPNFQWKSISIHDESKLKTIPENINYVIVSPIYKSISKSDYYKSWNFSLLKILINKDHKRKYIALGGITPENYHETINLGFADCAFLGSFWNEFFKHKDIKKMSSFLKLLKNG